MIYGVRIGYFDKDNCSLLLDLIGDIWDELNLIKTLSGRP